MKLILIELITRDFLFSPHMPTYAVKSAAPVAAFVASPVKVALQTAPLCPSNVPIQSPVSPCRNIGLPSTEITNNVQWNVYNNY